MEIFRGRPDTPKFNRGACTAHADYTVQRLDRDDLGIETFFLAVGIDLSKLVGFHPTGISEAARCACFGNCIVILAHHYDASACATDQREARG